MRVSSFPFYYGWVVLAASAVSEMLVQGATSYSAGLFVLPLQGEFHISRATANASIPLLFLGAALVSPFVGRLLDRMPIRLVTIAGALIFSAALVLIATASSLWQMALALFLPAAIGFMCLGPLTTSTLASRWFWRHRGLALGIAAIATSFGGLVVAPLLSIAIRQHGWRNALLGEAAILAVIIVALALLVLRNDPFSSQLADHPENSGRSFTEAVPDASTRLSWWAILARRDFWVPSIGMAGISSICQALVITLVPYGVLLGLAATTAASLIAAFSLAAALTKILAGILADRINQRLLLVASALCMMLALALLGYAASYPLLLAGAVSAGVALGCVLPTAAALIAAGFGSSSFGAAMGFTYTGIGIVSILAVYFAGMVFDRTHGYGVAFTSFFVLSAAILLVTVLFRGRRAG